MKKIVTIFSLVLIAMSSAMAAGDGRDTLYVVKKDTVVQFLNEFEQDPPSWEKWAPTSPTRWGFIARVGYNIGATAPLPIPAEIRGIKGFAPRGGVHFGIEGYKMIGPRWGLVLGMYASWEGFYTKADVMNYYMEISIGTDKMKGWFTGCNETNVETFGLNIPVMATFRMGPRWNVSMGPYFSFWFKKDFRGSVYAADKGVFGDEEIGYLRVNDDKNPGPIGQKIDFDKKTTATYDFSESMRTFTCGIELVFDWKAMKHLNVFGKLNWGLMGAFPDDFEPVQFPMYPIHGTFGVAYRY